MSCGDIFLGLIAVLFPPIAVWIKSGLCSADSLINILLCLLGYLPGLLHAWYIIAKNPEYDYEQIPDSEGQRVTYYYVSHESAPASRQNQPQNRQYGTAGSGNGGRQAPPVPSASRPVAVEGPATAGGEEPPAPPSYADAVRGDHKIQSRD